MGKGKPKFNVEKFVRLSNWKALVEESVRKKYPHLTSCCRLELQPNRRIAIIHVVPSGYLKTYGKPGELPRIMEYMARFQQEVFRIGIRPPLGSEMVYWGSWLNPGAFSLSIRLPHALWGARTYGSAKVRVVSFGNLRTKILYWDIRDEELLEALIDQIKKHGHLAQNSLHETLASIYFLRNYMGSEDVPTLRSVNVFSKKRLRGEFDAIAIRNNTESKEMHFVEAKTASGGPDIIDWRGVIRKKLSYQLPMVQKISDMGYNVYYHMIFTGYDEGTVKSVLRVAKEEVSEGPHAQARGWSVIVHGVIVGRRLKPLHVEKI